MRLLGIGFGNSVNLNKLVAVVSPDSAPVKRIMQEARDRGLLIDASYGRKTRSVLIMDSEHVILSSMETDEITMVAEKE